MAYRTAWLIGSYAALPVQSFTVNASAQAVAANDYYLFSTTNALSLLAQVKDAMTAAGVTNPVVVLQQNRKIRLSADSAFSVTWGTATLLRDLLGFAGDLPSLVSHQASAISPLLWSPGRQESSMLTPLGVRGHVEYLTRQSVSPYSGRTETLTHGSREFQRFWLPLVQTDRVHTSTNAGGTWMRWFAEVAVKGANWFLYRNVLEDAASTVATPLGGVSLGPYVYSAKAKGVSWTFTRSKGLERTEAAADIDIPCHVVPEYDS